MSNSQIVQHKDGSTRSEIHIHLQGNPIFLAESSQINYKVNYRTVLLSSGTSPAIWMYI